MDLEFSLSVTEKRILVGFVLVSLLFTHWMTANGNSRLDLTKAMVEDQSLEISNYSNNTLDRVQVDGDIYSDKAPGSSILAAPIYAGYSAFESLLSPENGSNPDYVRLRETAPWIEDSKARYAVDLPINELILRTMLVFFLSVLPSAATLLLIYRLLGRHGFSQAIKTTTSFIFGFGTVILFYSSTFMANTLAMFFGFLSFYLLDMEEPSRKTVLLAGVSGGLAGLIEYYALLVPLFLGFYLIWKRVVSLDHIRKISCSYLEKFTSYATGVMMGLLPLFIYNIFTTGNPVMPVKALVERAPMNAIEILNTVSSYGIVLPGFVIADGTPGMILRIFFGLGRGLFVYSPVLFLAIPGLYLMYRERSKLAITIGGLLTGFVLFNATYISWYGGATFGPRYLVSAIPFLSLPFAYTLERFWDRGSFRFLLVFTAAISVLIAFLGFNGVSLHPTEPLEGQENYEDVYSNTYEELTSLNVLLNPLPDYVSKFSERGATSNWIQIISGTPDKNLLYIFDSDGKVAGIPVAGKMVVLKSKFLEESLIGIILLLTWRRPLLDRFGIENRWRKTSIFFLAILLFLPNIGIAAGFPGNGWYEKESEGIFMSDRAGYTINAPSEGFLVANLTVAGAENRTMTVKTGRETHEVLITSRQTVRIPVEKGVTRLNFESTCDRIYRTDKNSSDLRCLSASFRNIEFQTYDQAMEDADAVYGYNWLPGANDTMWATENSRLWLRPDSDLLQLDITAVNPEKEKRLWIYQDSSPVKNTTVSGTEKLKVPTEIGELTDLTFRSPEGCEVPARLFPESEDERCISFRIHRISSVGDGKNQ